MPERRIFNKVEGIYKQSLIYSIVVPVHNEAPSLPQLFSELLQEFASLKGGYEIIFVDDGSSDRSLSILQEFQSQFPEAVHIIRMENRQGQSCALKQGFQAARGEIIISLDADLQNDPTDIPKLLAKLEEGYDCVCGWRKARQDSFLKAVLSKLGNILQRCFTGLKIHDLSCTLRAYRSPCVSHLHLKTEGSHRFIPLDLFYQGYKVAEIVSHHRDRKFGHSKYSHKRIFRVIKEFFQIIQNKGI
jgi:glycosyltransferase involved in cell wall biosynthesis